MTNTLDLARRAIWLAIGLCGALALLVLAGHGAEAQILGEVLPRGDGAGPGQVVEAVNALKGPLNVAMAALCPLGMAVGGGLMAVGQPGGIKIIGSSAAAGFVVIAGNGVAA